MKRVAARTLVALVIAAGLLTVHVLCPPLQSLEDDLIALRDTLGLSGLFLLGAAFTPSSLVLLPGSVLLLLAGYLYGPIYASIAASLGMTAAAGIVFLLGRTVARRWVERRFGHDPRFRAIDSAIGAHGFRIVLLLRLSPLFPYILLNYALSLTRVRFRSYLAATWIGMMPNIILWSYIASTAHSLAELQRGPSLGETSTATRIWQLTLTATGLVAAGLATFTITRLARRALRQALDAPRADGPALIAAISPSAAAPADDSAQAINSLDVPLTPGAAMNHN